MQSVDIVQTLCGLVRGVYRKCEGGGGGSGSGGGGVLLSSPAAVTVTTTTCDVINILIGFDAAEERMSQLLHQCSDFLTGLY